MTNCHIKYSKYGPKNYIPVVYSPFECQELITFNNDEEKKDVLDPYQYLKDCGKAMQGGEIIVNQESINLNVLAKKEGRKITIPDIVSEIMKPFMLSDGNLRNLMKLLHDDMNMGLDPVQRDKACVKMYPTYVTNIPSGNESGIYLALDFGGVNYRILSVNLEGNRAPPQIKEFVYSIPEFKVGGSSANLFDHIATTLSDFLKSNNISTEREIPLGFTFCFPCEQIDVNHATLIRWTKGFEAKNVVGKNVAECLTKSLMKYKLNISCKAVINDTVGTLASCALEDQDCAIGLVLGSGANACYIEDILNIKTLDKRNIGKDVRFMIVNTEWGAFGENGILEDIRTVYDRSLDKDSVQPGKQIFEKLISGLYLGELVRLILAQLTRRKVIFNGYLPENLRKQYSFKTKYLADCERDPSHLYYSTEYILRNELNVPTISSLDCIIVRHVCEIISMRAAFLAGAAVATILNRMNRSRVTIGVDGFLFRYHPTFPVIMHSTITQFKNENIQFQFKLSEDGSGKGAAAIVSALVDQKKF